MPELTPERLREIEARVEQAIDGNISSVMVHIEDSEVLLAALKQATEERDGFAVSLSNAKSILKFVANHTADKDAAKWCSEGRASLADPAECLKTRDAETATRALQLAAEGLRMAGDPDAADRLEKVAPTLASLRHDRAGGRL